MLVFFAKIPCCYIYVVSLCRRLDTVIEVDCFIAISEVV